MAKFRLEFSALSIAKLKQNKPPFRSTKAAFWKNKSACGFSQTAFCFFEDFCSNQESGELCFLKVKPWFADCGYGTKKKTIGRIVLPIVFICVALCD